MRTSDEIRADLENAELNLKTLKEDCPNVGEGYIVRAKWDVDSLKVELFNALTAYAPVDRIIKILAAEKDGRCVVLPCKPNDTYWHRNYDSGGLELNFELHDLGDHDETYRELNCCACWE